MNKINLQSLSISNSSSSPKSHKSQLSNSPRNYEKVFSTFQKPEFLYLSGSDMQCTFSPRIMEKTLSSAVLFYENQIRIKANKCTFDDMIKWKGDYEKIEQDQSLVQYLFPSLQGAQGDIDSEKFRNSHELAKKIILGYNLMLDYYGISLVSEATGQLMFANNQKERFEKTLFKKLSKSVHAYRIKRILNFLYKTGFLAYCHKFIEFMKHLIKGNQNLLKKASIGSPERIETKDVPISILAHLDDIYESDWKKYDSLDLNNEMQQKMLKNQSVFFKSSKYTKSVLLKEYEEESKQTSQQSS